ncbi:MAG: phosphodiester glycosidase family protein [Planctomycetota bacterium]
MHHRPLALLFLAAPLLAQIAPDRLGAAEPVARGVALRRGETRDVAGRAQSVAVLDVDLGADGVRVELGQALGLEPTSLLGARGGATAAINGGFFTRQNAPDGALRDGGREFAGASPARTAGLVLSPAGEPELRADASGVFAGAATVLAAGPMLLQDGVPPADRSWNTARHPRSAAGIDARHHLLLLAVDGRTERAAGMTLEELAATMQRFGCRSAMNLDGGGSTTLWVADRPGNGIVNHPCDNKRFDGDGERAVANAVLVFAAPLCAEAGLDDAERRRRTARDFDLGRARLLEQLAQRVRDFRPEELDGWIAQGLVDRDPLGGGGFARTAVSNLFFRDAAVRARRKSGSTWSPPPLDTGRQSFLIRVKLVVDADAVPAGETVRAWLPFPQEYECQHVFAAEHEAASSPMRAVHREAIAVAGRPTEFTTSYFVERRGVQAPAFEVTAARLPASRAFTEQRPPHVVATPELQALAASIAPDEPNPLRVARALYDWCADHLTYSFAREYSTIDCIPAEVLRTRRGDCGQMTLLYMTLCRLRGIPARWQSGWVIRPGHENLHDWCEIRIEPWGWLPVDVTTAVETNAADGLEAARRAAICDFAFGNLDCYRLVVNRDHARPLVPAKGSPRSDDVDFQRGEVEWGTPPRNVYYDHFGYQLSAEIVR